MSDPDTTFDPASLAARHGFPADAAHHLLDALVHGRGRQAQFHHPALGGLGQWHAGGMTMIGDMFNDALKARVAALCADLVPLAGEAKGPHAGEWGGAWWPEGLGSPSSSGAQNDMRYAIFSEARRLAIRSEGRVTLYDTGEHRIGGVSQQQSAGGDLSFTSQLGVVRLHDLGTVEAAEARREPAGAPPDTPGRSPPASADPAAPDGIPALIERLGDLRARGHLTEAEFAAKKTELLGRI